MKITDDAGRELARDGQTFGRLKVRGPAVAKSYFKGEGGDILDQDGFFDTGDVATISTARATCRSPTGPKTSSSQAGNGFRRSSLEKLAVGHPKVAKKAAVIGIAHPKWDERPLLIVALKPGETATKEEILAFMAGKTAKWWIPDDVAFVQEIPHTATGKIEETHVAPAICTLPPAQRPGRGVGSLRGLRLAELKEHWRTMRASLRPPDRTGKASTRAAFSRAAQTPRANRSTGLVCRQRPTKLAGLPTQLRRSEIVPRGCREDGWTCPNCGSPTSSTPTDAPGGLRPKPT